jgi:hypothetical protein
MRDLGKSRLAGKAFRLLFAAFAPTCAPVRSGLGQDRERASMQSRHVRAVPPPSLGFSAPVRPKSARTLAAAFGLAGSSATKTGGYNRLAGKT